MPFIVNRLIFQCVTVFSGGRCLRFGTLFGLIKVDWVFLQRIWIQFSILQLEPDRTRIYEFLSCCDTLINSNCSVVGWSNTFVLFR